jgi:hypothetical protein
VSAAALDHRVDHLTGERERRKQVDVQTLLERLVAEVLQGLTDLHAGVGDEDVYRSGADE